MAASDQWYITFDPSKTDQNDVPSDLKGLDRIEYRSYTELEQKLTALLEQRYPKRVRGSIDAFIAEQRKLIEALLKASPGLKIVDMSKVLDVDVRVLQLAIKAMHDEHELETTGTRKGMRYYLKGQAPT